MNRIRRGPEPIEVVLVDDVDGYYWSARTRILLIDARLDEANLIVTLARGLRLAMGRDSHATE